MKKTTEDFMKIAIAEARQGMRLGNTPFGSVIVKQGKVVARAHSTASSGPDVTAHAELGAIKMFCMKLNRRDLKGCTIYATGEPCPMCSASIATAKIPRLVIAANYNDIPAGMGSAVKRPGNVTYKEIFREYGLKAKVRKGVLRKEVIKLYLESIKRLR